MYIKWSNSGPTSRKFSLPKENIEIFKIARLFYYRSFNFSCFSCFYQVKCYLK